MNCVDWDQATQFCASRGARLPTEAEWEHAANGGDDRLYSWGNEAPDGRACWKTNGACPVGAFPAGAFGLFDMTGNLWEWTADPYGDYPFPPVESPGETRAYRGGSWSRRFEKWMRVRLRNRDTRHFEGSHLGFRCARGASHGQCPFGQAADGTCVAGAVEVDCRPGKEWNGVRCAADAEPGCGTGHRPVPGHGCERDVPLDEPPVAALDLAAVQRRASAEFDADCGKFQAMRPHASRFEGSTHDARNAVVRGLGCKNRDVGVGWNSACCP